MSKSNKSKLSKPMPKDVLAAKILTLIEHGREEITDKKNLIKFPIGSLISFMSIRGKFYNGGFITDFHNDHFIYILPDYSKKYRAHYKKISTMWVGDVYKVTNDIVSLTKTVQNKSNFPVEVDGIIIYYAARSFDKKRYMNTTKYKNIIQWYNYFINKNNPDTSRDNE